MPILIAASLFVFLTSAIVLFGYRRYVRAGWLYENMKPAPAAGVSPESVGVPGFYTVTQFVEAIGKRLPPSPANAGRYRRELIAAGYRTAAALGFYQGLKVTLALTFGAVAALLQFKLRFNLAGQIAYIAVAALGGFRLPDFVLARRVKLRRRKLRQALPDALDLMVVCAEAGLALERTLRVVGRELAIVHPELSDELNLATLEVTAGTRRRDALENLALRTGEPEVRKFVTVLVQADRFGTEISEALRSHSGFMRTRRRIDAEERAGTVSVKLIFPIFLFILPCILLVTVGPAALQIWKQRLTHNQRLSYMIDLSSAHPRLVAGALLPLVMLAAYFDIRWRRIPNWLTLSGIVVGLALNSTLDGWSGLRLSAEGFLLGFAVYLLFYCIRAMGAGDVKLMGAVGAIAGPVGWFPVFLATALASGLIAIGLSLAKGRLRKTLWNVGFLLFELMHFRAPYYRRSELDVTSPRALRSPHGVAIAAGVAVCVALSWR